MIDYYERRAKQLEENGASDFDISLVMTDMETEFQIPLMNKPEWNRKNPRIIATYRRLSDLRSFQP